MSTPPEQSISTKRILLFGAGLIAFAVLAVLLITIVVRLASQSSSYPSSQAYLYIAEVSQLVGGMPTEITVFYLNDEGIFQKSLETDRGELLKLRQSRIETRHFFEQLGDKDFTLPIRQEPTDEDAEGIIREYHPPQIRIAAKLPGENPQLWEGDRVNASSQVWEILAMINRFPNHDTEFTDAPTGTYIRASLLSAYTAHEFQKAGLVKSISESHIADNMYLSEALWNPFRLVFVPSSENPFVPFWDRFEPRRGALELSIEDSVYQIRSLSHLEDGGKRP